MKSKNKFRARRGTMPTIPSRISRSLDEIIRETAKKNNITLTQASDDIAKAFRIKIKGNNLMEEIKF